MSDLVRLFVWVPRRLRDDMKVAAAVHRRPLREEVAEAFRAWVAVEHAPMEETPDARD